MNHMIGIIGNSTKDTNKSLTEPFLLLFGGEKLAKNNIKPEAATYILFFLGNYYDYDNY